MEDLTILGSHGFVGSALWRLVIDVDTCLNHRNIFRPERREIYVESANVVNFISTVHNYNVFTNPQLDIDTNLKVLVDTLEAWRSLGYEEKGCYNFISSWFVYGHGHGVKEGDDCYPKGFYSITKRCAEQLVQSYCETYNLHYRILRLGNVIGPGDKKVSKQKNALQYLANEIKAGKEVGLYGDGKFYRDIIHVNDAARAIALVIEKGELDSIYNIGNGRQWNFRDILFYLRRITNSSSRIVNVEPPDFHKTVQTSSFYMDVCKLHELGFRPEFLGEKLFDSLVA